ncbi:hypothetical protein MLD38_026691 [Melastoma candidum]|uniref:Uncharacterized protein n=1 Tax=Melastoma candidum TaxID=119954 RepID=A0ACB9NZ83_9MYRT|nr:hypothetical protein MLD38_026691 [Melastoma candidum]
MADGIWLEDELELIGDGWRPGRGSITWILSTPISSTSLLLIRIASGVTIPPRTGSACAARTCCAAGLQ